MIQYPWQRYHNRRLDGCFGSGDGGYDDNGKHVRKWVCGMCISGKECRRLAKHRYNMRQAGRVPHDNF